MRYSTLFSFCMLLILLSGFFPFFSFPYAETAQPESKSDFMNLFVHQSESPFVPQAISEFTESAKSSPIIPSAPAEIQAILDQITTSSYKSVVSLISSRFGSRVWNTPGNDLAVEYVSNRFESFGLDVTHHYFGPGGPNVIGTLPGGSLSNNQCIIVGAHLDTYPAASPGADDNGSGIAAILEIARAMSQYIYNYTIMFVAFNAEEQFFVGSMALADDLELNNVSLAVVYNFDMLLWDSPSSTAQIKTNIIHNGGDSGWFASHAADIGKNWVNAPVQAHQNALMVMSDHGPFWDHHIPAVWFFEFDGLNNPYIHSIADSITQSEYSAELGALATKTAAAAVADFATIVSTNTGFPDIEFITPTQGSFVKPSSQVPIVLTINDALDDVEYLELSIEGGPWLNATDGLNATHCEYILDATGMYGSYTIHAQAYDAEGWITHSSTSIIFDKGIQIQIHTPEPNDVLVEGEQNTIWINVTDPDGRYIPSVQIRINATSWEFATEHIRNHEYYYTWTPTSGGSITIEAQVIDGNGNHNTSLVSVTVTNYPPIITSVWINPLTPLNTDPVQIYTEITQDSRGSGIDQVLVFYSIDYSNWRPRLMELIDSDISVGLYMVTLDPAFAGAQVRFYIQVRDNFDNIAIDNNNGTYYVYYVGANLSTALIIGAIISIFVIVGATYYFFRYRRRVTLTPT